MTTQPPSGIRLYRGNQAEYELATFDGKNHSGFRPLGKEILIHPDRASGKSSGGVTIPDEYVERMNVAAESGVIIACGTEAFSTYPDGTTWKDYKPVPGDRVVFERYGGREVLGHDGVVYRVMTFTCVGALEEAAPPPKASNKKVKRKKKG